MNGSTFKIDLHVHSKHSKRPSQWILQKLGTAESFTEPMLIYNTARARGMDMVTITDHNVIDGALEIAHLPNTFVSEEITTYFPEDQCKLHVLAYDVTEAQHADIQKARRNVFDLVPYLREQNITHVLAHPLFAVNDRLTVEHFEQCLLLFNTFEMNGTRDEMQNTVLTRIISSLNRYDIARLSEKHRLDPYGDKPWEKGVTGGSDDHSSLNIARVHTVMDGPPTLPNLLRGIRRGRGRAAGTAATPHTMAHNLYGIAYQFYLSRLPRKHTDAKHLCFRFADRALDFCKPRTPSLFTHVKKLLGRGKTAYKSYLGGSDSSKDMMLDAATSIIRSDPGFRALADGEVKDVLDVERQWTRFVSAATDRILKQFADRTVDTIKRGKFFDIFHVLGSAGSFYALLAPYFVGYDLFSRERRFCDDVLSAFSKQPHHPRKSGLKVAHFTDTLDEVNGVARTIRQQASLVGRHNKHMRVLTCSKGEPHPNVKRFTPVGEMELPEYPGIKLSYPPFMSMLEYCFQEDFDFILAATPGPVGLSALAISRILKLPFHGTYHTAFPQYVGMLTNDQVLEDAAWRFMVWFYNQMDVVYAPSKAVKQELAEKGIRSDKIIVYPRGVDTSRFHPAKRNGYFSGASLNPGTKFLYVGRVSKEKGLDVLCRAFRKVHAKRRDSQLIVVGDGPYLEPMKKELRGLPAHFTGVLEGEDLPQVYACADVFAFPSTTDTFGNVVLEAQASGVPCIVTDCGGPQENIVPDQTGLVVPAGDVDGFARAMLSLVDYPERRVYMSSAARKYMENRTFDATFLQTWKIFGDSVRGKHTTI